MAYNEGNETDRLTMRERMGDWWIMVGPSFWRGVSFSGHVGLFVIALMALWRWLELDMTPQEIRIVEDTKIEWCISRWGGDAEVSRTMHFASCHVPARKEKP